MGDGARTGKSYRFSGAIFPGPSRKTGGHGKESLLFYRSFFFSFAFDSFCFSTNFFIFAKRFCIILFFMKKSRLDKSSRSSREINSLVTSIQSMVKNGDDRYDVDYLYFSMRRLSLKFGQSMRFVMCKLLESGLHAHPSYSQCEPELREEFDRLKSNGLLYGDGGIAKSNL